MKKCNKWDIIHAAIKPFANTLEFMRIILISRGVDDEELMNSDNPYLWNHFIKDFYKALDKIVLVIEDDENKETDNDKGRQNQAEGD